MKSLGIFAAGISLVLSGHGEAFPADPTPLDAATSAKTLADKAVTDQTKLTKSTAAAQTVGEQAVTDQAAAAKSATAAQAAVAEVVTALQTAAKAPPAVAAPAKPPAPAAPPPLTADLELGAYQVLLDSYSSLGSDLNLETQKQAIAQLSALATVTDKTDSADPLKNVRLNATKQLLLQCRLTGALATYYAVDGLFKAEASSGPTLALWLESDLTDESQLQSINFGIPPLPPLQPAGTLANTNGPALQAASALPPADGDKPLQAAPVALVPSPQPVPPTPVTIVDEVVVARLLQTLSAGAMNSDNGLVVKADEFRKILALHVRANKASSAVLKQVAKTNLAQLDTLKLQATDFDSFADFLMTSIHDDLRVAVLKLLAQQTTLPTDPVKLAKAYAWLLTPAAKPTERLKVAVAGALAALQKVLPGVALATAPTKPAAPAKVAAPAPGSDANTTQPASGNAQSQVAPSGNSVASGSATPSTPSTPFFATGMDTVAGTVARATTMQTATQGPSPRTNPAELRVAIGTTPTIPQNQQAGLRIPGTASDYSLLGPAPSPGKITAATTAGAAGAAPPAVTLPASSGTGS